MVSGVWCLAGETLPRLVRTGAAGTRMLLLLHNRPNTQHGEGGLGICQKLLFYSILDVTKKHHDVLLSLAYFYSVNKGTIFTCTAKDITSVTVLIRTISRYEYAMFPASWPSIQYQCDLVSTRPVVVSVSVLGPTNGQNTGSRLLPGSC